MIPIKIDNISNTHVEIPRHMAPIHGLCKSGVSLGLQKNTLYNLTLHNRGLVFCHPELGSHPLCMIHTLEFPVDELYVIKYSFSQSVCAKGGVDMHMYVPPQRIQIQNHIIPGVL